MKCNELTRFFVSFFCTSKCGPGGGHFVDTIRTFRRQLCTPLTKPELKSEVQLNLLWAFPKFFTEKTPRHTHGGSMAQYHWGHNKAYRRWGDLMTVRIWPTVLVLHLSLVLPSPPISPPLLYSIATVRGGWPAGGPKDAHAAFHTRTSDRPRRATPAPCEKIILKTSVISLSMSANATIAHTVSKEEQFISVWKITLFYSLF